MAGLAARPKSQQGDAAEKQEGAWPLTLLADAVEIAVTTPAAAQSASAHHDEGTISHGDERAMVTRSPVRRHTRCRGCARRKVRCSKQLPCESCFEMCVRCEPPMLARGQPFLELAIAMLDIRGMNDEYMHALHRLQSSGRLDRRILLRHLLTWRTMSSEINVDITHGLFDQVCRLLEVTMSELRAVEWEMRAGAMRQMRGQGGGWTAKGLQALMARRIEQSETFKRLDDGATLLILAVSCPAGVAVGSNSVAQRMFCTAEQGHHYIRNRCILPMHALASMIAPGDRQGFFELMVAAYSTHLQPRTTFVKFCTSSGDIGVYILRVSTVKLPEFPDAHMSVVVQVEPAPTSRHLISRPGHRYHLVQAFRHRASPPPEQDSAAGLEVPAGPFVPSAAAMVPGIACLPLPPPYRDPTRQPSLPPDDIAIPERRRGEGPSHGAVITPETSPREPSDAAAACMRNSQSGRGGCCS